MRRTRFWTAGVVLSLATVAPAQLKSERLSAEMVSAASYSMDAHDVTAADAVAAFRKQTGIDVTLRDDSDGGDRGLPTMWDVKFDNVSRETAVRELARSLSLGIVRNGAGPVMLSRNSWSEQPETRDTAGVTLASITRTQSFPPTTSQPDALTLGLRVIAGRKPTAGGVTFELEPTIDEQGRTLTTTSDMSRNYAGLQFDGGMTELSVALSLPTPRPKVLPRVKGRALIGRPKTILRITADKLPDAAADCDFDGGSVSIGPPTAATAGGGYELPITITRGTIASDRWNEMMQQTNRLAAALEVYGDTGERLYYAPRSWSSGQDTLSIRGLVSRQDVYGTSRADNKPVPRPQKLKWDTVVESEPEAVPFEFKDVQVP